MTGRKVSSMKGLVLCDPLSKFTEEAIRAQARKFANFPDLQLEYVNDTNHMRMENPKEYNLRMEKEGPEGWITPDPEFMEKIGDADILFTCFCGVTEEMLKAGKNLKLVFIMRSGWENCNVAAARKLGIPVCNTPSRLAEPVADLTVAMMIAECRGILRGNRAILRGEWIQNDVYTDTTNAALCSLRIGLYGYGGIGRAIAKRLVKGFGAEVVAFDPYCKPEVMEGDGVIPVTLDELLSTSDIVSIHLRLVESTKNIINADVFAKMKPTAIFVNTARAGLVDQAALLDALESKKIRGACLDVFWDEPVPLDSPFLKMDNVTMTPHRAGVTTDIVPNTINLVIQDLKRFFDGEPLQFQVKE